MSDDNTAPIPWFRGPSFSFTTVSDTASNASTSRTSISRVSARYSRSRISTDAPSTEPSNILPRTRAATATGAEVTCLALSADGSVMLSGRTDGCVEVIHTPDGARGDFTQHAAGRAVRQVAVSADGRVGASASLDGTVRVFETDTLVQVAVLRQTGFTWANGCALSADGSVAIASFTPKDADRAKVVRFDWAARRVTTIWQGFHRVFEVRASYDASRVAFIRQGGAIVVVDVQRACTVKSVSYMKGDFDMDVDAACARLIVADKSLHVHALSRAVLERKFQKYKPGSPRRVRLSADASRALVTSRRSLHVRDVPTGAVILALTHRYRINHCAMSADGVTIAASDIYGAIVVWRPDSLTKNIANTLDGSPLDLSKLRSCLSNPTVESTNSANNSISPVPIPLSPVLRAQQAVALQSKTPQLQCHHQLKPEQLKQSTPQSHPLPPLQTQTVQPVQTSQEQPSLHSLPDLPIPPSVTPSKASPPDYPPPTSLKQIMQLVSVEGVCVPPSPNRTPPPLDSQAKVQPSVITSVDSAVPLTVQVSPLTTIHSMGSVDVPPVMDNLHSVLTVDEDDVFGAIRKVDSVMLGTPEDIGPDGCAENNNNSDKTGVYEARLPNAPSLQPLALEPEMVDSRSVLRNALHNADCS